YVYVEKEDKEKVYVDKKLIDTIYGEFYDVQDKNIKIIKGYATFGGRVVGRVYNLASSCESEPGRNFILVTGMTHPKDIMLVKKSKAIITDHGGVLSHAAIVSREMKKPCIISTKIATKVLKDGDLVEVNANQGIVKRLNT
ncbi:phosphoenolpyruvate synthase, partial [Candidatus Kuenenbacteria bacterium CG08_land_8_20_14_0_20_37_23]